MYNYRPDLSDAIASKDRIGGFATFLKGFLSAVGCRFQTAHDSDADAENGRSDVTYVLREITMAEGPLLSAAVEDNCGMHRLLLSVLTRYHDNLGFGVLLTHLKAKDAPHLQTKYQCASGAVAADGNDEFARSGLCFHVHEIALETIAESEWAQKAQFTQIANHHRLLLAQHYCDQGNFYAAIQRLRQLDYSALNLSEEELKRMKFRDTSLIALAYLLAGDIAEADNSCVGSRAMDVDDFDSVIRYKATQGLSFIVRRNNVVHCGKELLRLSRIPRSNRFAALAPHEFANIENILMAAVAAVFAAPMGAARNLLIDEIATTILNLIGSEELNMMKRMGMDENGLRHLVEILQDMACGGILSHVQQSQIAKISPWLSKELLDLVKRGITRQNAFAASQIYSNVHMTNISRMLGYQDDEQAAVTALSIFIDDEKLPARINLVGNVVEFSIDTELFSQARKCLPQQNKSKSRKNKGIDAEQYAFLLKEIEAISDMVDEELCGKKV